MEKYKKIWKLALPYLKQGRKKDVVHVKCVVKAMELIVKKEGGDAELLIPAAILHDVGWSKVPVNLQKTKNTDDKIKGLKLHLIYSVPIIENILGELNYESKIIKKIIKIVLSHKFKKPKDLNKRLLIDADNLSDAFKSQFISDVKQYEMSRRELYDYRKKTNSFYTKTAKKIFNMEINKRINNN